MCLLVKALRACRCRAWGRPVRSDDIRATQMHNTILSDAICDEVGQDCLYVNHDPQSFCGCSANCAELVTIRFQFVPGISSLDGLAYESSPGSRIPDTSVHIRRATACLS